MSYNIEKRKLLIATFNQNRAAIYARFARLYRDEYLGSWLRFVYDKKWLLEKVEGFQIMAEVHSLTARLLMDIE